MKVALFDYGAGNLHSLGKALSRGARVGIASDPVHVLDADALVLPGVGAFGAAAERLAPAADAIRDAVRNGFPVLGICLGMQLLFDASDEGAGAGLGIIPGRVRRLEARRVPHMGWNLVRPVAEDPVVPAPLEAYFANSYVCAPVHEDDVIAATDYEGPFAAAVRRDR
ncbi:MAG: imidazole glycerol phosphate synthase subunit HisH, partial [Gemmatimonadetes bacterium]|nr:imidazole glycerol phosphate synthase subunit HisH [Gemmatimonadota bacterium]NIQ54002.1 imidazole glycerol phosphate synthase subunit HisH [Gemmatimonadota bacterium]NIU74186.1 imidazole glycerol phosphate synthase subunit HisH [Gammaproteobacteria bacterium]NIX44217.1 imidazole glycerol phosphate synthase subunit HisH [Gemmatimonadota bacterium]